MPALPSAVTQTMEWLVPAARADLPSQGSPSLVGWLAVPVALLLVAAVSSVRLVSDPHRAVVTRFGRTARVAGPGLVFHVPGLEEVLMVSLRTGRLTVATPALTRDGVAVTVTCSAAFRVEDPRRAPDADPDPAAATASALEAVIARAVSRATLVSLLVERDRLGQRVAADASATTRGWGVRVLNVTVADVEARLTAELLHARAPDGGVGM